MFVLKSFSAEILESVTRNASFSGVKASADWLNYINCIRDTLGGDRAASSRNDRSFSFWNPPNGG